MSVAHLTLKQLRAVQAVYASRRISTAAEALNVTQSAVSVLIRQAEAALGSQLFERTTRSLVPTVEAEHAIGIIDRVLGELQTLDTTLSELHRLDRGRVHLVATPATGAALLPETVRRYRDAYPGVSLVIDDCAPNQFFPLIAEEKAEFGIGTVPETGAEFDWQVIEEDALGLVVPDGHAWERRESVAWRELADVPLIVSRRDYGIRSRIAATFAQLSIRPQITHEIGFFVSATWMTQSGLGLAILPRKLASALPGVRLVPLVDPVVTRPTAIVTRRGRVLSSAAARFVEMLRTVMAERERPAAHP